MKIWLPRSWFVGGIRYRKCIGRHDWREIPDKLCRNGDGDFILPKGAKVMAEIVREVIAEDELVDLRDVHDPDRAAAKAEGDIINKVNAEAEQDRSRKAKEFNDALARESGKSGKGRK